MYSDGRYHQALGYLHIQFGNLDQACLDYLNAIDVFQRSDDAAVSQLNGELGQLDVTVTAHLNLSQSAHLKIEILRLCRLGLSYSHRYKHHVALQVLDRGLQLSDQLVDLAPQEGQYCAAIVLGMMGKIYYAQRYYLFALASFKAALDAYKSLDSPDTVTQGRIAVILCDIANIAEITKHPDIAVEYYLDALWYSNTSGQQARSTQIVDHLNKLCDMPQPVEAIMEPSKTRWDQE